MTFRRDLTWKYLDSLYHTSLTYQFARYALALTYDSLPPEVVRAAKRCLLDALGCGLGAYDAPGRPVCETTVKQLGGTEEATILGSGLRTSAPNATLVNSFMVRFLDYNDIGGGGHNSDSIPAVLAVAEREKASGRDLLTSLVISYELGARCAEAGTSYWVIGTKGWTEDIRGGLSLPPALGKLLGMNEDQIANAIGACASHSLPLKILDTDKEENFMSKNLRFGWVAYNAILCCLLAKNGFTGPVRIVEGENGLRDTVMRGDLDFQRLLDFSGWRIPQTRHKSLCLNGGSQGHVSATLALVRENDLKPEDIVSVRIKASRHESHHTTSLPKKYPRNAETADHSAFYANAIAIKERAFGPDSFQPEKFTDPVVLDLIEKITVEYDPSLGESGFQGISEITTRDGRRLRKHIANPHGFGDDPLTDKELEDKFREMAVKYLSDKQIGRIFETIWDIEKLEDIRQLTKLLVFPPA